MATGPGLRGFPVTPFAFRNTGKSLLVDPTRSSGPRTSVTVADASLCSEEAGSVMMTATLVNNGPTDPTRNWRPVAYVMIGNAGVGTDFEVDFGNGTNFSVGGSALRVNAYLQPGQVAAPIPTGTTTGTLGAFISLGGISRTEKLKRTFYMDDPLAAAAFFPPLVASGIAVPRFATSLLVFRRPSSASFVVHVYDQTGTEIYDQATAAGDAMQELELTADAFFVRLENTSAAPIVTARFAFGVAL